jgi:hypothetical protein
LHRHDQLKQLPCKICRLNSVEEADDPKLQRQLLQLVGELSAVNPTPRPAESDLINGRCAVVLHKRHMAKA